MVTSVRELARSGVGSAASARRVEIEVGSLDPRLKLAPCAKIEPQLPAGAPLWGRTRVMLRCVSGPSRWSVYLPITVKVYARALVAAMPLAAGSVIGPTDVIEAEADIAAQGGQVTREPSRLVGRTLARPLAAGDAVRDTHLKVRHWFAAGEAVKVVAIGPGWRIVGDGQALSPGLEGQMVRIRTESGRIVSGRAVAEREVEVAL